MTRSHTTDGTEPPHAAAPSTARRPLPRLWSRKGSYTSSGSSLDRGEIASTSRNWANVLSYAAGRAGNGHNFTSSDVTARIIILHMRDP